METFFEFTILGLVAGCIYAMTATGLVVTYTTTGIFNFGHGGIGMMAAFLYWQLTQGWHVPGVIALIVVLFVAAPLFGIVIERLLMRPLYGAPVDLSLVVTLGLLILLIGAANVMWSQQKTYNLPGFFGGDGFHVGGLIVFYYQVLIVALAIAIAIGLRLFFVRSRTGIAMRAVVDNPDLVAMAGGRPYRIQQLSWALGCSMAALAGVLIAQGTQLNINALTLNVVNGYAAAMIGRLRNLPATVIGAIGIGLAENYLTAYAPGGAFFANVQPIIPMIVMFAVLIILPQDRLRSGTLAGPVAPKPAGLRASLVWGAILLVASVLISGGLSVNNLQTGAQGFALAFILLSLTLLTGYGGMVSLCQLTFVGVGAFAMAHAGAHGSLLGALAAIGLAIGFGVLVALPTLRLRGLYLALATLAFAQMMDTIFFNKEFGEGGALNIDRLKIFGLSMDSPRAFFIFCAVIFTAASIAVLALRRGPFGRRLAALNDSPAACATLGVNINWTKLVVFAVSAGLAGLGGVLYGGVTLRVSNLAFITFLSSVILLLARIGGINTVTGAFLGAMTYAIFTGPLTDALSKHHPQFSNLQYLLVGVGALTLGRDPNGMGGRVAEISQRIRTAVDARRSPLPVVPAQAGSGEVPLTEEGGLARASR